MDEPTNAETNRRETEGRTEFEREIGRTYLRLLGRMDEMNRRIQHEALSVGFGAAIVTTVSLGFLNIAGLDLKGAEMWIVFMVAMLTWGVSAGARTLRLTNGPG